MCMTNSSMNIVTLIIKCNKGINLKRYAKKKQTEHTVKLRNINENKYLQHFFYKVQRRL